MMPKISKTERDTEPSPLTFMNNRQEVSYSKVLMLTLKYHNKYNVSWNSSIFLVKLDIKYPEITKKTNIQGTSAIAKTL